MKKAKLKSTTPGRTKTHRTRGSVSVTVGRRRYEVPAKMLKKLEIELEPHLVGEETVSFDQLFGESDVPEWAEFLRGLRYREDMTQQEFAEAIGVSQSNLSAMENGRRVIGKELAKRIGKTFDTDYRYFL